VIKDHTFILAAKSSH